MFFQSQQTNIAHLKISETRVLFKINYLFIHTDEDEDGDKHHPLHHHLHHTASKEAFQLASVTGEMEHLNESIFVQRMLQIIHTI